MGGLEESDPGSLSGRKGFFQGIKLMGRWVCPLPPDDEYTFKIYFLTTISKYDTMKPIRSQCLGIGLRLRTKSLG
jgi:hypothetical protein